MGFSGDVGPGFVFVDILINVSGGGWVVLGTAGRGVSWGCIAAFSTVVLRAVSLEVSSSFTGEAGRISHVVRVDGGGGVASFFCKVDLSAEWMGLSFWSGSERGRWGAFRRRESENSGGSSMEGWPLNDSR